MPDRDRTALFEQSMLPHLDAAYSLARWLTRNGHDAEDVVQEAYLRALRFFGSFNGQNGRKWLLAIVRNTCYTWLQKNREGKPQRMSHEDIPSNRGDDLDPEARAEINEEVQLLRHALGELPLDQREVVVLRDLEGLSYKEIGEIIGVPLGTVMSRLARARERLRETLDQRLKKES